MNVGVVIPVRDGARYLGEALDSVLAQTHPAADIVVVDDGSRDRTARVAAAYAPRVRCLSVAGRGIGAARNRGVAEVGGELIAFLDGDDSWPPDRLERQLSAFTDDASSPDLVFGYVEQFLSSDLDAAARAGLICPETPQPAQLANTMLVRRTVWERVGPFSTTAVRSEFLDWLLRARDLDLREVMIEDVVLRRRLHATNHGRVLHDSAGEYAVTLKRALDRRRRAVTRTRAPVVVLGAGPAGLTAGYLLARRGEPVIVLEAGGQVGGLARTEVRDGYRFDLGGHRFYTKHAEVDALWREIMGDELLTRPRQSRIYWRGRFLDYPLHGADVVRKLGAVELMLCGASYLMAATRPRGGEQNLQEWVSNRFGRRLYKHFFEAYTQKVWGVPASEIRAEWAAQRIRGLSFASAARAALTGGGRDIVSLVGEFRYPRLGPGQMWDRMQDEIRAHGGEVRLNAAVTALSIAEGRVVELVAGGETIRPSHVISSLPLRTTVGLADPEAPDDVREAARGLRYRDFLTVLLVLSERNIFPDNWIYVHDPGVRVGRIQNFRAWSPSMVPNDEDGSVGLEYFCFAGDELWRMDDEGLVALATQELSEIGLADPGMVKRGYAVRVEKAYPMYDAAYPERVATIRAWLSGIANLQQIGRNGLHRYNSSDHSMLTGMRAVDNIVYGARHDIWALDTNSDYQEEYAEAEQPYREVPETEAMARPLADVR